MTDEDVDPEFESLLDFLRESRGFDFSGYKRSSLMRRMSKRMQAVGVKSYGEYVDYLQVHPDEFAQLFDYILINVTGFFRDPAIWDYLSSEVVPRIAASKGPEDPIRAWSAGSASGEEAYSLAVVLAEAVGLEAIGNRGCTRRRRSIRSRRRSWTPTSNRTAPATRSGGSCGGR